MLRGVFFGVLSGCLAFCRVFSVPLRVLAALKREQHDTPPGALKPENPLRRQREAGPPPPLLSPKP